MALTLNNYIIRSQFLCYIRGEETTNKQQQNIDLFLLKILSGSAKKLDEKKVKWTNKLWKFTFSSDFKTKHQLETKLQSIFKARS